MSIFSGTHYCSACKKEINWLCPVNEGVREDTTHSMPIGQRPYEPKVLSTPQAKVHVLCIVCEDCGQIDIIKRNRNTRNPYKFR